MMDWIALGLALGVIAIFGDVFGLRAGACLAAIVVLAAAIGRAIGVI